MALCSNCNIQLNKPLFSYVKRFKSLNSASWIKRRENDPYVAMAKTENYRCRSAYKLLEINKKYNILRPGLCAVDLGAAPGSWTQVLVKNTNSDGKDPSKPKGFVVSVDRLPIFPIEGATVLSKIDFTLELSLKRLQEVLETRKVDLVVSDMAPNATGVKELDQDGILNLARAALRFAVLSSSTGAHCLIKLWGGGSLHLIEKEMARFYNRLNHVRPRATQTESSELFLLARDFKGLKIS